MDGENLQGRFFSYLESLIFLFDQALGGVLIEISIGKNIIVFL